MLIISCLELSTSDEMFALENEGNGTEHEAVYNGFKDELMDYSKYKSKVSYSRPFLP